MNSGTPLVAIRHAPTEWNAAKRLQGRTDIALSAEGIAAAKAWRADAGWAAYRVIASPLKRAQETARLLFPEREIALDPRLMEMDFGSWEGRSLAELRETPGAAAKERESLGLDFSAPGGETPRQVQARVQPLLNEIAAAAVPTVIVTHKAVLRALMSLATGWAFLGKPPVKIKADTAHLFRLDAAGKISVEQMNVSLLLTGDSSPHPYPLPAGERGFTETGAAGGDKGSGSSAPSPQRGEGRGEGTKRTRYLTSQPRQATHDRARSLRRRMTDAEKKLWFALRDRRLQGHKFCRQFPVGPYYVDFLCRYPKLVIEVDGGQHSWQEADDAKRTAWLESQGHSVLRFWNNEILGNLDGVLQRIIEKLEELQAAQKQSHYRRPK
jgi:very-short-patch-repair endonuclease/broad specificity phosphatase PhoE